MTSTVTKNTFILSGAGILIKIMGAMYKLPIIKILGQEGLGIYSAIYPFFAFFLIISTSAFPLGISAYISKKQDKDSTMSDTFLTCIVSGIIATTLILVLAHKLSYTQGNPEYKIIYFLIAPIIFITFILGAFRGYFQGNQNMKVIAKSQIIEQLIKILSGLLCSSILIKYGVVYGVMGLFVGIGISECITVIFLVNAYKKYQKINISLKLFNVTRLLKVILPICLVGILIPFSDTIVSTIIFRLMYYFSSTFSAKIYGLAVGIVEAIINIPLILSSSLATTLIPAISKDNTTNSGVTKNLTNYLMIIWSFVTLISVMIFVFSDEISYFLTDNLKIMVTKKLLSDLFKIGGLTLFSSSFIQIINSVMQGLGMGYKSLYCLLPGTIIKILTLILFALNQKINIFSVFISQGVGMGFAVILEILCLNKYLVYNRQNLTFLIKHTIFISFVSVVSILLKSRFDISITTTIIKVIIVVPVIIITYIVLNYNVIKKYPYSIIKKSKTIRA